MFIFLFHIFNNFNEISWKVTPNFRASPSSKILSRPPNNWPQTSGGPLNKNPASTPAVYTVAQCCKVELQPSEPFHHHFFIHQPYLFLQNFTIWGTTWIWLSQLCVFLLNGYTTVKYFDYSNYQSHSWTGVVSFQTLTQMKITITCALLRLTNKQHRNRRGEHWDPPQWKKFLQKTVLFTNGLFVATIFPKIVKNSI